jgi:hypothetical protein
MGVPSFAVPDALEATPAATPSGPPFAMFLAFDARGCARRAEGIGAVVRGMAILRRASTRSVLIDSVLMHGVLTISTRRFSTQHARRSAAPLSRVALLPHPSRAT